MGKDILERYINLLFDDSGGTARDLSGDLVPGSLDGPGFSFDEVDMTGVSDTAHHFLAGYGDNQITAQFYMNDTATTGAFTVLSGQQGSSGTLTIQFGTGAAPTTGDPEWEGEYTLMELTVGQANGAMVLNATFRPQSGQADPAWGTVA